MGGINGKPALRWRGLSAEFGASSLAQADALAKLLIDGEQITKAEFEEKLSAERAEYQAIS